MEVILLERVHKLGRLGDKVAVKPGFARNYLIPYGKAVSATAENLVAFEKRRVELERNAAEALAKAEKRAAELNELMVIMQRRTVDDEGKLYGSVGVHDIAEAVNAMGMALEKREITMPSGPIRTLGEYSIEIQLYNDITSVIKLQIEAEK
ncbi:MAG: 50S ribosomal protein L9 [Gammaproteobacteria bacterium RIFCSPHIGHO2_12_FULL_35_23]|nr:MAG: 50S ribosomal protein L9 [Gammaproteobacteria bacterium RIFCSPHIGHO2_12_FULL_35_23]